MGALYVKQLAEKTHRGLRGRVEAGCSGGGNSYGYKVVRETRDGQLEVGMRAVNPSQAEVVRRIYRVYALGEAPRAIATSTRKAFQAHQEEPGARPPPMGMLSAARASSTTSSPSVSWYGTASSM